MLSISENHPGVSGYIYISGGPSVVTRCDNVRLLSRDLKKIAYSQSWVTIAQTYF